MKEGIFNSLLKFLIVLSFYGTIAGQSIDCSRSQFTEIEPNFVFIDEFVKKDSIWSVGGNGQIGYRKSRQQPKIVQLKTDLALNTIVFFNNSRAFVLGENGIIFLSNDSGKIWIEQSSKTKERLNAIDCVDKNNCWIVGKNGIVLTTNNGGNTWKESYSGYKQELFTISFTSRKKGWIAGAKGIFLETFNGGKTWDKVKNVQFEPTNMLNSEGTWWKTIRFYSKTFGCLAGDNRIICTSNGGKSWKKTVIDDSKESHYFVGFSVFKNFPIVLEKCGRDFFSKDFGKTWIKND